MDAAIRWFRPTGRADDEVQRANALIDECASIEQYQSAQHQLALWNAVLYSNRQLVGFNWGVLPESTSELWPTNIVVENIINEIGDSFLAKASSSPLKPTPVPHGASWKVERAVREVDRFMVATWRATESEDACVRAFLDAFISSIGCVADSYDVKNDCLCTEAVFFDQIVIDNRECVQRRPPRTYRIRRVLPRADIEARWGVQLGAPQPQQQRRYVDYRDVGEGWEVLVEAWRLPDASGPGRHTIAVAGHLLVDEEWNESWVPLEFFHWEDRLSGFFTRSGVEQLVPYQVRQNELNDAIAESQDIACRPRILSHANANLDLSEWDNAAGRVLTWSGTAPTPFQWPTNLNELYQERDRNKAAAYSHVGLSEMFANADLPPQVRLDSSAGVREFRNMEDSRHLRKWTNFQSFRLRVARMHMRVLGQQGGGKKGAAGYAPLYQSRRPGRTRKVPYEAIRVLNADQYSWTLDAASMATELPASRRETLRDWVSRGLADPGQAQRMESNPDIERGEALKLASYDDIDRHIGILEDGGYEQPNETTNLAQGIGDVTANLHRLRCFDDVPEEVIANHMRWITTAEAMVQAQQQQLAAQQMAQQAQAAAAAKPASFAPSQVTPGTAAGPGAQ